MGERRFTNKYDDIISLPHHVSRKRPQMSLYDRAAQFSPFAALTGHGAAIEETARLTGSRVDLDEYEKEQLRGRLQYLSGCVEAWNAAGRPVEERPAVEVTYFVPDLLKEGGEYVAAVGRVKKFDQYLRQLVLLEAPDASTGADTREDGTPGTQDDDIPNAPKENKKSELREILVDEILRIEGKLFREEFGFAD